MTKEEIHQAIESGRTVNWVNGLYIIEQVKVKDTNRFADPSRVNGKGLRISCIDNGFGSLMSETCFSKAFIS